MGARPVQFLNRDSNFSCHVVDLDICTYMYRTKTYNMSTDYINEGSISKDMPIQYNQSAIAIN